VRPQDADWPTAAQWEALGKSVEGRLLKLASPFAVCTPGTLGEPDCEELFRAWKNPYATGDQPALTQTSGWVDAWVSEPSAYAVAATRAEDVAAAVDFARTHRLRLVVKGGGQLSGHVLRADSLLVWTRKMNAITLHDASSPTVAWEVPPAQRSRAVRAIWMHTYDAVTTRGGQYVKGGGCHGGRGGWCRAAGWQLLQALRQPAARLEAEVVTADGRSVVNAAAIGALWLKGGGGGSLGVSPG
jgi:hypothetical protein